MGISTNSHGRKSDKETQSPLLKIFKDIMMREERNNDPEKRNLIDQDKRRKQSTGSRTRVNRRSCESSSSGHRKRSPYKSFSTEQRLCEPAPEAQHDAYRNESKSRWWTKVSSLNVTNEPCKPGGLETKKDDETCSCVSCALRRIIGSEYACITCLLLLFSISIVAAFCLVYKNVPTVNASTHKKPASSTVVTTTSREKQPDSSDSERLKRKIDVINESFMKNELGDEGVFGKAHYDDLRADPMDLSGVSEIDFGPNLRELNLLDGNKVKRRDDTDFPSIMESAINDQSSDKLKEFYKKLVQTDALIKNLRKMKMFNLNNELNRSYENKPLDRYKRSLKVFKYPKNRFQRIRRNIYNRTNNLNHATDNRHNKLRIKRFGNASDVPTGFVIEKKKIIVQYQPLNFRKLVPKCSHVPKESHIHHEHQLKHPFYQNTQRLDELLDRFLNKNLPEIVADPFGFDSLFQREKNKCKHPNPTQDIDTVNIDLTGNTELVRDRKPTTKPSEVKSKVTRVKPTNKVNHGNSKFGKNKSTKATTQKSITTTQYPKTKDSLQEKKFTYKYDTPDIIKLLDPVSSSTNYERKFYEHEADMLNKEEATVVTASPSDFELMLSVSTIMNPEIGGEPVVSSESEPPLINRVPNIRRLLQIDGEEEDNLGYEDFKEVLTDHMENEDESEGKGERKKRGDEPENEGSSEPPQTPSGSSSSQPEEEDKISPSQISISKEWSSVVAESTPSSLIKDVFQKEPKAFNQPNSVNNPNWKGALPLYPDELSSMIKEKSDINKDSENLNKLNQRQEAKPETRAKRKLSDIEYIEDYLDSKLDRLDEMAQAYSDYGVLEGKKDNIRNEKHPATNNNISGDRVKLSVDDRLRRDMITLKSEADSLFYPFYKHAKETTTTTQSGVFERLLTKTAPYYFSPVHSKTPSTAISEGFRVELRPTHGFVEDNLIAKLLQSHIKLNNPKKKPENNPVTQDFSSMYPRTQFVYSPELKVTPIDEATKKKNYSGEETNEIPNNLFAMNNKRKLLSVSYRDANYNILENNLSPVDDSFGDDQYNHSGDLDENILENLNFKRETDIPRKTEIPRTTRFRRFFKNKIRHPKHFISGKHNNDDSRSSTASNLVFVKTDSGRHLDSYEKDILNYMAQVTQHNVRLFSAPYLYPVIQDTTTTAPITDITEPNTMFYKNDAKINTNLKQSYQFTTFPTVNTQVAEIKPVDSDAKRFQTHMLMALQNHLHGKEDSKYSFKSPFHLKFGNAEPSFVKNTAEKSNAVETNTFPSVKRVRRYKRSAGTAKAMLEKSDVTINEAHLGLPEIHKNVSLNSSQTAETSSLSNNANVTADTTPKNMTLSDFFMLISNWFKALEGIEVDDKPKGPPGSDLTQLLLLFNKRANESKRLNRSSTTDSLYPLYDSDMIENIGHRSRVLLSIKEDNVTEDSRIDESELIKDKNLNVSGAENKSPTAATIITVYVTFNKTNNTTVKPEENLNATTIGLPKVNNTKRKVKRNAVEGNLISWNDMYDDEYGIRTDNFNNVIRDKYSKERDFIKRSGKWMQDKIRKFADNLKGHDSEVVIKKRTSRAVENVGLIAKLKDLYRKTKRQLNEGYDADQKVIFNSLQANMIEVCKKAANAVKQTRNAEVKGANEQGTLAATLMQQLVRLLTDVVDYQVEQKTCSQLPPDLKVFLEWLTKPEEEFRDEEMASSISEHYDNPESLYFKTTPLYSNVDNMGDLIKGNNKPIEHSTITENTPLFKDNGYKSQYVDALRSVQELIDQYEEMSDEEKSKMTGVKFYLENQLLHLNKQLSGYDLYNLYEKTSLPLRYKRGYRSGNSEHRHKRKHYKFVRNFGKKHTRTTAAYYDGIPTSEKWKSNTNPDKRIEREHSNKVFDKIEPKRNERNLKDIYYKAVAEAKKYSTSLAKNHMKQDRYDNSLTTPLN